MSAYQLPPFFFVFDVESVGLHGEPFAVGWVVLETAAWTVLAEGLLASPPEPAARASYQRTTPADMVWVAENVLPALPGPGLTMISTGGGLRRRFWSAWKEWEERGAVMAADVPWPVEARFLMECAVYTYFNEPLQSGPYPLIDIASVRLAKGLDPLATIERLPHELPKHNPLADAAQSARLLAEALRS